MKIMHLSDLHLGKKINNINLEEDQKFILEKIIEIAEIEKVEAIIIAGDIYDKALPSVAAINLLDDLLVKVKDLGIPLLMIAGNHDSAERLAYGGRLFTAEQIYVSPAYNGEISKVVLRDQFGPVNFYLLPFLKPALVRNFAKDREIISYDDALAFALAETLANLDTSERNVLIAHQFVTGGSLSDSEEVLVGGLDNVSVEHFAAFDYVALGHLHNPQQMGRSTIRYCGTPLKYSLSEAKQEKSLTIVDFGAKGRIELKVIPLKPWRDMRIIRGKYEELTFKGNYANTNLQDLVGIELTDEQEIPDVTNRLRTIYPNIVNLKYDNQRTRSQQDLVLGKMKEESPLELFSRFYELQNNQSMTKEQIAVVTELLTGEDEV